MLRTLELTDDQQRILNQLSSWGGVLDFGFYTTCNGLDVTEDDHREAINLTFAQLRTHLESDADSTISALAPTKISWKQFLGPRYDFQRQGLLVHGDSQLNSLFFYQDDEREVNIVNPTAVDDDSDEGLAYAYSDPPYPLCSNKRKNWPRVSMKEKGELFHELLSKVLDVSEASIIYRWPTDWCNYFDAGNDWWGTFLWTLANQGDARIVVIAASSTD